MKNPRSNLRSAVLFALLLACGAAQAQLKAGGKSSADASLGSGLSVPQVSSSAVAPADDDRPPEAVVEDIAACMLGPLPKDWVRAQVEVTEVGSGGGQRQFEAKYTYVGADGKTSPFTPCDLREPALSVYKLNRTLEPEKRDWKKATLVLSNEGKFEVKYDYDHSDSAKPADTPKAKPAAKPAKKK